MPSLAHILRLIFVSFIFMPTTAMAVEQSTDEEFFDVAQRPSLGVRLSPRNIPLLQAVGLSSLLDASGHRMTMGFAVGESRWRMEPALSLHYMDVEKASAFGVGFGLMPQYTLTSSEFGITYMGVSFDIARISYRTTQNFPAVEQDSVRMLYAINPVIGAQGLIGDVVGIGFEVGPFLSRSPSYVTYDFADREVVEPQLSSASLRANLILKYYF